MHVCHDRSGSLFLSWMNPRVVGSGVLDGGQAVWLGGVYDYDLGSFGSARFFICCEECVDVLLRNS